MPNGYFHALYEVSRRFIDELALPAQASALTELMGAVRPEIERRVPAAVASLRQLRGRPAARAVADGGANPVGLNTVGMLADRLTVVAMKEWVLERRLGAAEKARALRDTQVSELLDALAAARPGHSSFTQKLSPVKVEAAADTWEEAYLGLLSVNILLWEAQEVLYGGRIEALECAELRRYIAWFSEGNMRRNEYIAKCEGLFWQAPGS